MLKLISREKIVHIRFSSIPDGNLLKSWLEVAQAQLEDDNKSILEKATSECFANGEYIVELHMTEEEYRQLRGGKDASNED